MKTVNIQDAGAQLPQLLDAAERGETVLIVRPDKTAVVLHALPWSGAIPTEDVDLKPRVGGQLQGQIWMAPDFDEFDDDLAADFGLKTE
jgi:antitoxin (DNA-binding transcriptional repressor) of toxin-antitoxin stability system